MGHFEAFREVLPVYRTTQSGRGDIAPTPSALSATKKLSPLPNLEGSDAGVLRPHIQSRTDLMIPEFG